MARARWKSGFSTAAAAQRGASKSMEPALAAGSSGFDDFGPPRGGGKNRLAGALAGNQTRQSRWNCL
jgi:hypothetical protein